MCGIAGFIGKGDEGTLRRMTDTLSHRGPDDENYYIDGNAHFGFRRLSIIDVASGRQPIESEDGNIVVMLNGEIYNYQELQKEVLRLGHRLKTKSDTEVIVHLYEEFGEKTFEKLEGMFAIAIWDKRKEELTLVRDRVGKKPIYYSLCNGTLVFGSEVKAVLKYPELKKVMSQEAMLLYLSYEFVPTPFSIFEDIYKLEEGSYLKFAKGNVEVREYWDLVIKEKSSRPLDEQINKLDVLLKSAVQARLVSEVPLGVYLSGGIDSSTIAWYAQMLSDRPIETFSISFDEKSYDESSYARDVAKMIGSNHHEERLTIGTALTMIEESTNFFDEPFADASILPTMLLSKFSRKTVTVALGGDGGDELFLGYQNFKAHKIAQLYKKLPQVLTDGLIPNLVALLPQNDEYFSLSFKANRFLRGRNLQSIFQDLYWRGSFSPKEKESLLLNQTKGDKTLELIEGRAKSIPSDDLFDQLTYLYIKQYLMDDVMLKVDRASMAFSQEIRAPFLDYRVVEFAANLPTSVKLHNLTGKYILKKLMTGRLPEAVISRPKKGFGVPVSEWLRKELRPLAEELLGEEYLKRQGIFNSSTVRRLYDDHLSKRSDNRKELWTLLSFQLWYKKWM